MRKWKEQGTKQLMKKQKRAFVLHAKLKVREYVQNAKKLRCTRLCSAQLSISLNQEEAFNKKQGEFPSAFYLLFVYKIKNLYYFEYKFFSYKSSIYTFFSSNVSIKLI